MNRKIVTYAIFRDFLPILALLSLILTTNPGQTRAEIALVTGQPHLQTPEPSGRVVFRLAADAGLRMGPAGLAVRQDFKSSAAAESNRLRINNLTARWSTGSPLAARMPTAVAAVAKAGDAAPFAHLARYAELETGISDPVALRKLAARLQADPAVDLAWLEPVATPAALDFDARGFPPAVRADTTSASFEGLQGYLTDAPDGVGALSMRSQPGALGAGITVIDVEGGWLWTHEDLPAPVAQIGDQIDALSWRNHGTAVVGVIRGQDNGVGVTGIAPACEVGHSSVGSQATSEAILAAGALLDPGDVIVIELHAPGPEATGVGQEGYVPMEFWQDNFAAIEAVTRNGIIVVEAAGNGQVDLDAPIYQGLFDPDQRHSGAIMIGATTGVTLFPAWFTNHGQRVDLNGWGSDVTTLAYGDLQGEGLFPEEQWYTALFNGTSSATPIVTGAVVSLTGMVRAALGIDLDARLARDLLRTTGTPSSGTKLIGTRPDLVTAYALAATGIGEVTGVVTDQATGLPLAGVLVAVDGGGSTTQTQTDGSWRIPLLTGPVDLTFSAFGYEDGTAVAVVTAGTATDLPLTLMPRARVDITGIVTGAGQPLAGAHVDPLLMPLTPVTSLADGSFVLPAVPVDLAESLLVSGASGFGAQVVDVSTFGATTAVAVASVLKPVDEDFSLDGGGFTASHGLWTVDSPPAGVTGGAFTGARCWGIGNDGLGYADDQSDTLTSPIYDLSGVETGAYYLSFHYFSATEAGFDGVLLEAGDGSTFALLEPVSFYSDTFLGGLGQRPGWSGTSPRWTGAVFDIGAWTGGAFRFRLIFGSDGGVTDAGFFVDGITLGPGLAASPVGDAVPRPVTARLQAWPNPFNPVVNLEYSLTRAGHLEVAVFDLRGRRVRTLHSVPVGQTRGLLRWDGRDGQGRELASGVYLVRLQGVGADRLVRRIVLTK